MSDGQLSYVIDVDAQSAIAKLKNFQSTVKGVSTDVQNQIDKINGGLGKLDGGATAKASSGLEKVSTATKKVANDTQKMAKATDATTTSTKRLSDALETQAQKEARVSKMVDESIRKMTQRNRAASSSGFKVGMSVPRDDALLQGQNRNMGLNSAGKIPSDILNGVGALAQAAGGVKKTEQAIEATGKSLHLTSGAFREIIVLAREASRGDFTRMAGSASILAQRLGVIEVVGPLVIAGFAGISLAVGTVVAAMAIGSTEANRFNNQLKLSGNYAGLTSSAYHTMSRDIAESTATSISQNEALINSLAATNQFTKEEIASLVTAADQLSKATGQSAEDVINDFAKMAQGPAKYAEEYQQKFSGVITPTQVEHIRKLEETGQKEQALAELVKVATDGIAKNTQANTGIIIRAWNAATNALSNFWTMLKQVGAEESKVQKLAGVNAQLMRERNLQAGEGWTGGWRSPRIAELEKERDTIAAGIKADEAKAKADAARTRTTNEGAEANKRYRETYAGLTDSTLGYRNAVADLDRTIAKMKAAGDPAYKTATANRGKTVEALRKQYMPDAVAADNKAAGAAAASNRKAENAAARDAARSQREYSTEVEKLNAQIQDLNVTSKQKQLLDALDAAGLKRDANLTGAKADEIRRLVAELQAGTDAKKVAEEIDDLTESIAKLSMSEEDLARYDARKAAGLSTDLEYFDAQTKKVDNLATSYVKLKQAKENADRVKRGVERIGDQLDDDKAQNQSAKDARTGSNMSALRQAYAEIDRIAKRRHDEVQRLREIKGLTQDQIELLRQQDEAIDRQATDNKQEAAIEDQLTKAQTLSDFLVNLWSNPREAMKQFFTDLLKQLLMAIAKATILKSLMPGGGTSGGIGGILKSVLGSVLGGGHASGGSVSKGMIYPVGENGPELFAPGISGGIIPNYRLGSMGGGSSNFAFGATNIIINGNASATDRAALNRQLDEHRRMTVKMVDERLRQKGK